MGRRAQRNLHRVILPLAAFVAVLPILIAGATCGHDFDFHLLSWLEASRQFAHLTYPRWAYTPAFNGGEPRFIFYPPMSWSLGATLGLLLPWKFVPVAYTWLALTLSGIAFRRLARRFASPAPATLAAVLYLANPYMLFTAYERSAFAELLAAAWIPLLLAAALAPRVRALHIAVPIALLWLTNAPAAVMCCYALAFMATARLLSPAFASGPDPQPRTELAVQTAGGTLLGLALASLYIVPAAWERRFVQIDMAVIEGMRPLDHFLFHRMAGHTYDDEFHNAVVHTASVISVTLLAGVLLLFLCLRLQARRQTSQQSDGIAQSTLLPLTLAIAFLLIPLSLPVWNHLPEFQFLQFPWRLTALLGAILALFAAMAWRRLPRLHPVVLTAASIGLAAVLVVPAWRIFHQRCDAQDALPARIALFQSNLGTEPTDEYTPVGADADALHPHDPPFWLLPADPDGVDAAAPPSSLPGPAPEHITLTLPMPEYLVLNRRQYPAWQVRVNGSVIRPLTPEREDGLITVALPAGTDTIDLVMIWTPDETYGIALSVLAAALALALRRKQRLRPAA